MATRVLVVEDDRDVRAMLRMLLEDESYDVVEAADGIQGWDRFEAEPFDLVLIDLKLPGRHGFELCRLIRQASDVPIVIVTAQIDDVDVVVGLEAGADDYVTKPFTAKVLTARLRALLRRAQGASGVGGTFRFGDVEVAPREGEVRKAGQPVHLTKTEFRVLCDLAEHAGQVLSRDQLLHRVWGYEFPGDGRLVDAHIRRVRMKVEDDPSNPRLIVTVRGLGYRLDRP
jgi:two-component system, OmpR family, response regulator MtrA